MNRATVVALIVSYLNLPNSLDSVQKDRLYMRKTTLPQVCLRLGG
jgi:hypothetical protein